MEIAPKVHLLESTKGSHAYLVMDQEPVLIDTGMPGKGDAILAELKQLGVDPKDLAHILLTHHDVDHVGNAMRLQTSAEATLWAPEEDVPYIHGELHRPGIKRLFSAIVRPETPMVERTYAPGQWIGQVEVIPCPGHTPGHVAFRYGDVLFAGDLVASSKGRLRLLGWLSSDVEQLRRSLRTVGSLSFDWICPAHGDPVRRGNLWDAVL